MPGRQIGLKRTAFALRRLALAIALSGFNQESVEFVINSLLARQMPVQELLGGGIPVLGRDQPVPGQDAPGVSIGYEEGLLSCVKQNGVRGFRAQPSQLEQLAPKGLGRMGKKSLQRASVDAIEPSDKRLEGAGFLPEVSRGADAGFKLSRGSHPQICPSKESGFAKAPDRQGDIPPAGILSQDGAEDDLQASARRPPSVGGELQQQRQIVPRKHYTGLNSRRLSRALHRLEINTVVAGKSSSGGEFR